MSIQDSDKLLVGRDTSSFQISFDQSGIAKSDDVDLLGDQVAATYLPLTGGTMTGTLNMQDSAAVKTRHLDSGQNSNLQIKRNGDTKITVGTNSVIFNKIPTCSTNPTNDDHLTRKKWVDDNKAAKNHSHTNYASSSHTHNYASSNHNHDGTYVKGNYTITRSNGNYYIS